MTDERMDARLRAAGERWRANEASVRVATAPVEPLTTGRDRQRRTRRMTLLASAAVVAAALVAGGIFVLTGLHAGPAATEHRLPLQGTVWRLLGYGSQRDVHSTATLYIKGDTFIADDACDLTTVHVDTRGGIFFNGTVDERAKGCTDSAGEVTFNHDQLEHYNSYRIDGADLTISAAGYQAMHLVAADDLLPPTTDLPTVVGATWQLAHVTDAAGHAQPVVGKPTLTIDNGLLTGSNGCSPISTEVGAGGQEIVSRPFGSAADDCAGAVGTTAGVIDTVLGGPTVHAQVNETQLTLTSNGAGTLVYQWVPANKQATDPKYLAFHTWRLDSIAGTPTRANVRMYITPVEASIMFGCGAVGGDVRMGVGALSVTGIQEGAAAGCSGDMADLSNTVDSFFNQKPALWRITDGKLLIYGGGAQAYSLVFDSGRPAPVPSPTSAIDQLVRTSWKLISVETEGAGQGSLMGVDPSGTTLYFDGKGGVSTGYQECPDYQGHAAIRSSTVTFTGAHFVESLCPYHPGPADPQARNALRAVLKGTAHWAVDGTQLTLTKGDTTLTFES